MKAVPDLVEEIELNVDETGIDREYLTFVLNEWDAQALEEALLLKDAGGLRSWPSALPTIPISTRSFTRRWPKVPKRR